MQPEQQTLIFLSPGFPASEAETNVLPLQQQLVKHIKENYPGLLIVVVTLQYPYKKVAYTWNGITVYPLNGRGHGNIRRLGTWTKAFKLLRQLRQEHNIIGLYSFWLGECALIGQRFAARYRYKHFCWICGQDAKPNNHYVKMSGVTVGNLVALSDSIATRMVENYGLYPANVIAGGLEPLLFENEQQPRDIDLLSVGSLIPLKQQHVFLEVVARLRKQHIHIKAVICGDGPDRKSLEHKIDVLNLRDSITLTGQLPYAEVTKLMQRARILLHPSNYEGLGMVMLEALYAGAQVISFVKPFKKAIANWHIVDNSYSMALKVKALLCELQPPQQTSVAPFMMHDTARSVLQLFDYNEPAITRIADAIAPNESLAAY